MASPQFSRFNQHECPAFHLRIFLWFKSLCRDPPNHSGSAVQLPIFVASPCATYGSSSCVVSNARLGSRCLIHGKKRFHCRCRRLGEQFFFLFSGRFPKPILGFSSNNTWDLTNNPHTWWIEHDLIRFKLKHQKLGFCMFYPSKWFEPTNMQISMPKIWGLNPNWVSYQPWTD